MKRRKNFKKKSFFFDDYNESEITFSGKNINLIKISSSRVIFLFTIFLILISIFSIKIIYLSLYTDRNFLSKNKILTITKERRDVVDRNGIILARNINIYSAGIRPKLIKDKKKFLLKIRLIFPELDIKSIENKINNNKFFYLKKRLTPEEKDKLWLLGNKAFVFESKPFRIYPQKNLFSHVLGQIDDNNIGISGIEKFFDKNLKKKNY